MRFVQFMQSVTGRTLRVAAGTLLTWYGLAEVHGGVGIAIAAIGFVLMATGLLHVCLAGSVCGVSITGYRATPK